MSEEIIRLTKEVIKNIGFFEEANSAKDFQALTALVGITASEIALEQTVQLTRIADALEGKCITKTTPATTPTSS
jgi:hypothetical protein